MRIRASWIEVPRPSLHRARGVPRPVGPGGRGPALCGPRLRSTPATSLRTWLCWPGKPLANRSRNTPARAGSASPPAGGKPPAAWRCPGTGAGPRRAPAPPRSLRPRTAPGPATAAGMARLASHPAHPAAGQARHRRQHLPRAVPGIPTAPSAAPAYAWAHGRAVPRVKNRRWPQQVAKEVGPWCTATPGLRVTACAGSSCWSSRCCWRRCSGVAPMPGGDGKPGARGATGARCSSSAAGRSATGTGSRPDRQGHRPHPPRVPAGASLLSGRRCAPHGLGRRPGGGRVTASRGMGAGLRRQGSGRVHPPAHSFLPAGRRPRPDAHV